MGIDMEVSGRGYRHHVACEARSSGITLHARLAAAVAGVASQPLTQFMPAESRAQTNRAAEEPAFCLRGPAPLVAPSVALPLQLSLLGGGCPRGAGHGTARAAPARRAHPQVLLGGLRGI